MTLRDLLVHHGISHRIEMGIRPGMSARYVVMAPFVSEGVARALVAAAIHEGVTLTFQYVHRTVTAGHPLIYQN